MGLSSKIKIIALFVYSHSLPPVFNKFECLQYLNFYLISLSHICTHTIVLLLRQIYLLFKILLQTDFWIWLNPWFTCTVPKRNSKEHQKFCRFVSWVSFKWMGPAAIVTSSQESWISHVLSSLKFYAQSQPAVCTNASDILYLPILQSETW